MDNTGMEELEADILKNARTAKAAKKKAAKKKAKEEVVAAPEVDPLMEDFEEKPMGAVTIQELEAKIQQWSEERREYEEAKAAADRLKAVADNTGEWLKAFLVEHNKTSYKSSWGQVIVATKFSLKFPKDTESRRKVFDYIACRAGPDGLLGLQSIASATFNKLYREYLQAAEDSGEKDFLIPGTEAPTKYETVSLRKS